MEVWEGACVEQLLLLVRYLVLVILINVRQVPLIVNISKLRLSLIVLGWQSCKPYRSLQLVNSTAAGTLWRAVTVEIMVNICPSAPRLVIGFSEED